MHVSVSKFDLLLSAVCVCVGRGGGSGRCFLHDLVLHCLGYIRGGEVASLDPTVSAPPWVLHCRTHINIPKVYYAPLARMSQ